MTPTEYRALSRSFAGLRIGILGDFCLDRYLEIDPELQETSIETGLEVHNVIRTRGQPGGAGTILNNLVALGVGTIIPIGFAGEDGEGWELKRALGLLPGVQLEHFLISPDRQTFTYTKPLIIEAGKAPRELNRLDMKNWTSTPTPVNEKLTASLNQIIDSIDVLILLEQVDTPNTGVLTPKILTEIGALARARPDRLIIADSRRGLDSFPRVSFKMNLAEFMKLEGTGTIPDLDELRARAGTRATRHGKSIFITLAEKGIIGASPTGEVHHAPALPCRGEIDIVGAGDAVTANLAASLAAGADLLAAMEIAMAAATVVIHELGTTGAATVEGIAERLGV